MGAKKRNLDLRLLSYFHQTSKVGSITKAASALNIAQPTLSKALKLLEYQIGAELFERRADGVRLTPIGERLLQHASVVAAQVHDAEKEILELSAGIRGEVRIGAGPAWVRRLLPQAITGVRQERPDLKIRVSSGFDESLIGLLERGELDFVVAEKPLGDDDSNLLFQPLTSDKLVVVGRKDHPAARLKKISIEELLGFDWALPPIDTLARRKLDGQVISLGFPAIQPVLTSSSYSLLMKSASLSDLLLYTTRSHLLIPEATALCEISAPKLGTARDAGLIFRKPGLVTPATRFVAEMLEKVCRSDPVN